MNHIRDIIETVMALRKSQSMLYKVDLVLTELQAYKHNPEVREELWDAIKTTAELLDKVDIKKEIK